MVKRIENPSGAPVTIEFDGKRINAFAGENLAAVLLAAGIKSTRSNAVSGALRAPFCMMGACYECLVQIDEQNLQACMMLVQDGMKVSKPALREGDGDD